jgi:hypothetical protein
LISYIVDSNKSDLLGHFHIADFFALTEHFYDQGFYLALIIFLAARFASRLLFAGLRLLPNIRCKNVLMGGTQMYGFSSTSLSYKFANSLLFFM